MDTLDTLLSSLAAKLILSSAVVAALATSLVNLFALRATNRRLVILENLKHHHELTKIRLANLQGLLEKLSSLRGERDRVEKVRQEHPGGQSEYLVSAVKGSADRHRDVLEVLDKARVLLDKDLQEQFETLLAKLAVKISQAQSGVRPGATNSDWKNASNAIVDAMELRQTIESAVRVAINEQLARIFAHPGASTGYR